MGVSIIASTTFHSNFNMPISWVYVLSLEIITRIVHPRSLGISLRCHINWVISTSFYHRYGLGGVYEPSAGYVSHRNFLKCSVQRWTWSPASWSKSRHTDTFNPPFRGVTVNDPKGCDLSGYRYPGGSRGVVVLPTDTEMCNLLWSLKCSPTRG